MPFTLRNLKEDLEDASPDGAPDLEFRSATEALELEKSGLSYQRVPPNDLRGRFLDELDIAVLWLDRGRFAAGSAGAQSLGLSK